MFKKSNKNIIFLILVSFFILQCQLFNKNLFSKKSDLKTDRKISSMACSVNQSSVTIIMYHRFDGKYPSTSVTKQMLEQHLHFFHSNGFNVIPLEQAVQAIQSGAKLPSKTLAITIDDAYRSAFEIAHPLFLKYQMPYTVFVNTQSIDQKTQDYMSWSQLRSLTQSNLVSLQAHSHVHAYMVRDLNSYQREQDIKRSVFRIYQETKSLPKYFAYPYGETNIEFINELKNYHWNIEGHSFRFKAAFTTQSGPAGCSSSLFALPRFALNMNYGRVNDLFRHKMMSRHFPVQSFYPKDLAFCVSQKVKKFSLNSFNLGLKGLNCFSSHGESVVKMKSETQADILLSQPFLKGLRQRINCTLPTGSGQFFWFGKEVSILKC